MSGIEEIIALIGGGSGGAGAGAATGGAAVAGAEGLAGTSMLAPFTAAGSIEPGTGMLSGAAPASAGSAKGSGKGLLGSGADSKSGGSGQMAMELMKMVASRRGPNAPAAMYPPPGGQAGKGQPTAQQFLQMLSQRGAPQMRRIA